MKIFKEYIIAITLFSMLCTLTACWGDSNGNANDTEVATEIVDTSTEELTDTEVSADNESDTQTLSAGVSNIEILSASADNTALSSGSATVTIGGKQISLSGAYVVDGISATITGGTYTSTESDQNVFLVINGGSLTISNAEIIKSGNASTNDSQRTSDVSDDYNFYGMNSVILVVGEGSTAQITDCTITSDCSGANAIFSTAKATADVNNVKISTTGNSSRGVYATYEGVINADRIDITTSGAHCAPIATDRGGGYVTVKNSTVSCSGDGSPCIYSTGDITAENVIGVSTGAQAAVIEGKNSITMTDCKFTVSGGNNGVMLYQSMSGDAADKDATANCSTLTMTNSTIENTTEGAMFYITNTTSVINLNGGNTLTSANNQLVSAATGRWGNSGSNGGKLTLNINGDTVSDSITADDISTVSVNVTSGSFSGTTSGSVTVS